MRNGTIYLLAIIIIVTGLAYFLYINNNHGIQHIEESIKMNKTLDFKNSIDEFAGLMISLIEILVSVLIIILLIMLIVWMSGYKDKGTIIMPFENATGEERYNGKGISDSLITELQKIKQIHNEKKYDELSIPLWAPTLIILPPWEPTSLSLTYSVTGIGNISVGGTGLSIGNILLVLKRLWPISKTESVINGSIQKYGSAIRIVAYMPRDNGVAAWEVSGRLAYDHQIPGLVRDLAFKIAKELSPECSVKTWVGLKHFTEALKCYHQHKKNNQINCLESSRDNCLKAMKAEQDFIALAPLFYSIGNAYIKCDNPKDRAKSEELFMLARKLEHEYIANIFADLPRRSIFLSFIYHNKIVEYTIASLKPRCTQIKPFYDRFHIMIVNIKLTGIFFYSHWDVYNKLANIITFILNNSVGYIYRFFNPWYNISDEKKKLAYILNSLGTFYRQSEAFEKGEKALSEAILLYQRFAIPWYNLGNLYNTKGDHENAERAYLKAMELDLYDGRPWVGIGCLYQKLAKCEEDYKKPIRYYKEALKRNSDLIVAYTGLAICYKKTNMELEYNEQIKKARLVNIKDNEYNRGCLEAVCGNISEALDLIEIAVVDKNIVPYQHARQDNDLTALHSQKRFQDFEAKSKRIKP